MTIYVSGEKMRGDFVMQLKQDGGAMKASTIQKDGVGYTWGDSPFGSFATKINLEAINGSEVAGKKDQPVDFNEELDYSCRKWNADNSKFDLPAGVNFSDISAGVQQINQNSEMMQNMQCSACDQAPDAASKAQCLAALGC